MRSLSPDLLADAKKILLDPKEYNFGFKAINDFFNVSNTLTPQKILVQSYIDHCASHNCELPKPILYTIMKDVFGEPDGVDETGNLSYFLKRNK